MTWLKAFLISCFLVFAPLKTALAAVLVLCLIDMVVGIVAASRRGETITSAGLQRTLVKLCVFEVCLMAVFLGETYLALDTLFPAVKTLSALIASAELLSIMENLNEISGQKLFSTLLAKLGSKNDKNP